MLVPILSILMLILVLLSILLLILVLVALRVVVPPLLLGRPALVGFLLLFLGVTVVVRGEGFIQVVVVALVGVGGRLRRLGVQLQGAVPNAIATVDQQT